MFRLLFSALLPAILSVLLYLLLKKTAFGKAPHAVQQAVIGVCFGGLAIFFTEYGIHMGDAILDIRSAAPLTAGLLFGWPSGMIAGVIGGVERWFASLWGGGEFARLAGALSSVVAGIVGAGMRKFMLDNKRASWFYGLAAGITTDVLQMLLVFLTNLTELQRAFVIVQKCAVPTIVTTGASVMLAIISLTVLVTRNQPRRKETQKIAQTFQRWLLVCVLLAFLFTCVFTQFLQTRLAHATADYTLELNLNDVRNDIRDASNENLLKLARQTALTVTPQADEATLNGLAQRYDLTEINLVNGAGIITASTNPDFVGYDMASGEQSAAFLCLLEGEPEYVQDYQPTTYDDSISRKYAGVALASGGFLQVGYDAEHFQSEIRDQVESAAKNRHIGQDGFVLICDAQGEIVSDRNGHEGEHIDLVRYAAEMDVQENTRFTTELYGISAFCMYTTTEGYYIIATLPTSEAMFSRDLAVYILAFMETIVFAVLFTDICFLIKKLMVENIQKVNDSLAQITGGNLDVTVDVRTNEEFASLSDDINSTVDTLKHYIDEAAARIDKELEFAKSIQHSALPSVFPPYPNRKDFDIFASMDTAKEVGGDFYDFFFTDRDHLAILIADVSGKGIPAAMFMMRSRTLLKSMAETGMSVEQVFADANDKLCENNDADMFVTAWMGVVDLKTGLVEFVNAGHNPPLVYQNGAFTYLKSKACLVLACVDGVDYEKHQLQLHPGDALYLYTDGVTEATDAEKQLYGEDRLEKAVNTAGNGDMQSLCRQVKQDVDAFVGDAPQFDDMTMLALRWDGPAAQ